MNRCIVINDYRINNYTLICDYVPTPDMNPVGVYLRNFKRKKRYDIEPDNIEVIGNMRRLQVRLDDNALFCGTWNLVFVLEDGTECFSLYRDMVNDSGKGSLIELSRERFVFDTETKINYMCILDRKSYFAVRKWHNKSELIKKANIVVKDFKADGLNISFNIVNMNKNIDEAEVWIWSRALKAVKRITINAALINDGVIEMDFSEIVEQCSIDMFNRLWEVYLVFNAEGIFYQSRIEIRKPEQADKKNVFISDIDEEDRYVISCPAVRDADGNYEYVYQVYFNYHAELCAKLVAREFMYTNMYRARIQSFRQKHGILKMRLCFGRNGFGNHRLILRYCPEDPAGEKYEYEFDIESVTETAEKKVVTYSLDYSKVKWIPLRYELLVRCEKDGYEYELKAMGKGRVFNRNLSRVYKNSYLTEDDLYVFIAENLGHKVVFECRRRNEYDAKKYRINECVAMFLFFFAKLLFYNRKILMFYEKFCTAAQDNSYYMFEYFMEHKTRNIKPVYVLKKEQPKYRELKEKYGPAVVAFMSVRHLVYVQIAAMFVSTDSKRHCYRWRSGNTRISRMLNDKKFVFLQHGVIGFKKVDYIYGKQYANRADLFVASSEFEKNIINKWFGYDNREIIVTGLARWDKLVSKPADPPVIFYMPTWRNWIFEVDDEAEFMKTDYYREYSRVLASKELAAMLAENSVKLVFCMHPKFGQFYSCLRSTSPDIEIFDYNSCNINEMLMKCSMFVTDYSSASWDVYYMDKPVLFYQFDAKKYSELQGSYINLEKKVFGERVTDFDSFINALRKNIADGFYYDSSTDRMKDEYLPIRDSNHRQRIYDEIVKRLR